jgi:CheY-like chemotaxis protein
MSHPLVILIIDDSKGYTLYLKKLIKHTNVHGRPIQIISIDNIEQALPQISEGQFDIIFADDVFPKSKMSGHRLLQHIKCRQDEHRVLISGRKLIKKVSLDDVLLNDVMLIKTISKRDLNSVYMGKLISAVFEEESEHATGKRFCKKQCIKI